MCVVWQMLTAAAMLGFYFLIFVKLFRQKYVLFLRFTFQKVLGAKFHFPTFTESRSIVCPIDSILLSVRDKLNGRLFAHAQPGEEWCCEN